MNVYYKILIAMVPLLMAVLWQIYPAAQSVLVEGQPVTELARPLVAEGHPTFDLGSLIPVMLIAITSALLVGLAPSVFRSSGHATSASFGDRPDLWLSRFVLIGCSALVSLFLLSPTWFSVLAQEDHLMENLSAALCFLSGGIFLYILASRNRRQFRSIVDRTLLTIASVIAFLIGLEEVSWFQRTLDVELPEIFANNSQGEINLHNFSTDLAENLYYSGAFFFFVLIPFLGTYTSWLTQLGLTRFMPGMAPLVVVAIACSYNYDMWVGIPTQLAFWMSAFIIVDQARRAPSATWAFLLWGALYLMCLSQLMYLVHGAGFSRLWDITEYKELLIAAGIFFYALELLTRMRDTDRVSESALPHAAPELPGQPAGKPRATR